MHKVGVLCIYKKDGVIHNTACLLNCIFAMSLYGKCDIPVVYTRRSTEEAKLEYRTSRQSKILPLMLFLYILFLFSVLVCHLRILEKESAGHWK